MAFPGLSIAGFSAAPNEGIVFFGLDDFENRTSADKSKFTPSSRRQWRHPADPRRAHVRRAAPAVDGLGAAGGFKLQVQDRSGQASRRSTVPSWGSSASSAPTRPAASAHALSTYDINVPQLFANVDRTRPSRWACRCATSTTPADQPRLALRQRLQPLRQDLPGHRSGRRALPRQRQRHHRAEDAQRSRRHGAAGRADAGGTHLPDPRASRATTASLGRHQWRAQARLLQRAGRGRDGAPAQRPAARHGL